MKENDSSSCPPPLLSPAPSAIPPSLAYAGRLLTHLGDLRREANGLCDVEIVAGWGNQTWDADNGLYQEEEGQGGGTGERVYFAHRMVLAAASPYFRAMFTGGLVEAKRQRIVLQSISDASLTLLLDFIYSGEVNITRQNVQELMIAADMIALVEVVDQCTKYLVKELEPSNTVGIYRFATDHNCLSLKQHTTKFVQENFVDVSKVEEFRDLPREMLVEFLQSEHLRVDSEYQVFLAAMLWIESDLAGRRRFIFDLLKHIRLSLVPSKLIELYLNECSDVSIKVALNSIRRDLVMRKGSLVALTAQPRMCAKKNIFVIGGSQRELRSAWTRSECTYDTVEVFDTFKQMWHQAAPMRVGRILPGIAVINGMIYVCGGEVDSQILANGEIYDPSEDTWTEMASMTIPRCEFGMCAVNQCLYAFGGWVGEDIGGSIERYDPNENRWTLIAKMPEPRFSMGIIAHKGVIYLVGGCTHSRRHMQELVSFNPVTGEWCTHASMLVPRSQMGCVVLDDHLYVVGGTNRRNEVLQSVERYSFQTDTWQLIPDMLEARASPSVAAADGKIYVFGGDQINEVNFYRARTTIADSECFDPLTQKWNKSVQLPESRSEAGAVVI